MIQFEVTRASAALLFVVLDHIHQSQHTESTVAHVKYAKREATNVTSLFAD